MEIKDEERDEERLIIATERIAETLEKIAKILDKKK